VVRNRDIRNETTRTIIEPVVLTVSSSLSARRSPTTPPAGMSPRNVGMKEMTESPVASVRTMRMKPAVRAPKASTLRDVSQQNA